MKPRSAKAKGTRLERDVASLLDGIDGVSCRKQPGSGIYSDFPHDCWLDVRGVGPLVVECKARKEGHRTLDKWLGKADLLVIRADRSEANVYMPIAIFRILLEAAASK